MVKTLDIIKQRFLNSNFDTHELRNYTNHASNYALLQELEQLVKEGQLEYAPKLCNDDRKYSPYYKAFQLPTSKTINFIEWSAMFLILIFLIFLLIFSLL